MKTNDLDFTGLNTAKQSSKMRQKVRNTFNFKIDRKKVRLQSAYGYLFESKHISISTEATL